MHSKAISLAMLILGGLCIPAHAAVVDLNNAAGRYAITPAGSSLDFAIDSVAGKGISGRFAQYDGSIVIDDGNLARSSVRIDIMPASVETGQERVDAFL
jgi:polyisoprenoid-binding protein YceI